MATAAKATKGSQTVAELAISLNTTPISTKKMEASLYHDLLVSLYRRKPLEDDHQRIFEKSQADVIALTNEMGVLEDNAFNAHKNFKDLKVQRELLLPDLSRTVSQIKEDLSVMGFLKDDASPAEIKSAIEKERESMKEKALKAAELLVDIEVAEKASEKAAKALESSKLKLIEEKENVEYWNGLIDYNNQLNFKIANLYEKKYNNKFVPSGVSKPLPRFLQGIPGQGKTSVYYTVGEDLATDLDLNFVGNITDNYIPNRKDLVMVVHDCAGENSAVTFGGLPKSSETVIHGQNQTVLTRVLNKRFLSFEGSAGGILLFDDISNATSSIQNLLLPVAQFNTFGSLRLSNCLIGFTGNLGIDGTMIYETSTALKTRVVASFVEDTLKDFKERIESKFNDAEGTMGVMSFLETFPENFARTPELQKTPLIKGYSCSRTLEAMIKQSRNLMKRLGGRGVGEASFLNQMRAETITILGDQVGEELNTYLGSFFSGTNELALKFINSDTQEKLEASYVAYKEFMDAKGQHSQTALGHKFEFTAALLDHAVIKYNKLKEEDPKKALHEIGKIISASVLKTSGDMYGNTLALLKNRLMLADPELATKTSGSQKSMNQEAAVTLAVGAASAKGIQEGHRVIIKDTVSGIDKIFLSVNPTGAAARQSLV